MKILRKRTQKVILNRLLANAIIAGDAVSHFKDPKKYCDAMNHIIDNLAEATYAIGGKKAMLDAKETFTNYMNQGAV